MNPSPTFALSCKHQFLRSMRSIHDSASRILFTAPDIDPPASVDAGLAATLPSPLSHELEGDREGFPFVLRRRAGGEDDADRDREDKRSEDGVGDHDICLAGILTPQSLLSTEQRHARPLQHDSRGG